jgi:hypothetical protein
MAPEKGSQLARETFRTRDCAANYALQETEGELRSQDIKQKSRGGLKPELIEEDSIYLNAKPTPSPSTRVPVLKCHLISGRLLQKDLEFRSQQGSMSETSAT